MNTLNTSQQIYYRLKENILNGKYKQGEKIHERKLAEEFSVSRTPIREALKILATETWVKIIPNKGAYINGLTDPSIKEIIEIRLMFEPEIINLLSGKISTARKKELTALLLNLDNLDPENITEFIKLDRYFHLLLITWTNNTQLSNLLKPLNDKIHYVSQVAIKNHTISRIKESIAEHKNIIYALLDEDFQLAHSYMTIHMLETKKNIYHQLSI